MPNLEMVPCPLCKNCTKFLPVFKMIDNDPSRYKKLFDGKRRSSWNICGQCGFVYQNPRPSAAAMDRFYLNSEYHSPSKAPYNRENYSEFAQWYYEDKTNYILENLKIQNGKVFDIGFGYGGFLKQFKDKGWTTYGVEADKNLFGFAKENLDLDHLQQNILDEKIKLDSKMDLVISNHAFEHFANFEQIMGGITKILKPGGFIFSVVPTYFKNRSSVSWQGMNFGHLSSFTHQSFNQLFSYYGFEEVKHTYRGWTKEIDDVWHLTQFTGVKKDPKTFYENPQKVSRYLHVVNPINTAIYSPVYSFYAKRIYYKNLVARRLNLLLKDPQAFRFKLKNYIKRHL